VIQQPLATSENGNFQLHQNLLVHCIICVSVSVFLPALHYLLCNSYQQLPPTVNKNWLSNINCCNKILLGGVRSQSLAPMCVGSLRKS